MAISFVGSHVGTHAAVTAQTVNFSSLLDELGGTPTLQFGDVVFVAVENASTVDRSSGAPDVLVPSGYTGVDSHDYQNDNNDSNFRVSYKVVGGTVDTSVSIPASNATTAGVAYAIYVFRGLDLTNPLDAAAVRTGNINTGVANGSAITPVTAGAWIACFAGAAVAAGAVFTNPSGMSATTNHFRSATITSTTNDANIGGALYTGWTSGSYDPAVFGGSTSTNTGSWSAVTLALRPALAAITGAATISNHANTAVVHAGSGVYWIEKTGGGSAYNASAVSAVALASSFYLRIKPLIYTSGVFAGVNSDPLTNDTYTSVDYAFGINTATTASIFESGGSISGPHTITSYFWIWRTGGTVGYGTGATLATAQASPLRTVAGTAALDFDGTFFDVGERVEVLFVDTSQTLTPSLFTSSQTFYSPTVALPPANLTPSLFTNSQTFYSPTVTPGSSPLTPSLFTNSQTFYSATVTTGSVGLTPSLFTNAQVFYSPTASPGAVGLTPSLFSNGQTFYAATVTVGAVGLLPSVLDNTQTFYNPAVTSTYSLTPALVTNTQTFYGPTVTASYALFAPLLANAQTFYSPTVASPQPLYACPLMNLNIFYPPEVELEPTFWQPPPRIPTNRLGRSRRSQC